VAEHDTTCGCPFSIETHEARQRLRTAINLFPIGYFAASPPVVLHTATIRPSATAPLAHLFVSSGGGKQKRQEHRQGERDENPLPSVQTADDDDANHSTG
jgi:hypothetical protein